MLHDLLPAVESKVLAPIDRLTLHTDMFALVQAGKNSTVQVLQLLEAFKEEDQYSVWSGITPSLGEIGAILDYTDFHDAYNVWGRRLLMPLFSKIGWQPKTGEKHTDSLLRSLTLGRLAVYAEPTIIDEARKLFDAHVRGVQVIPADIRAAVYAAIVRNATDAEFESFFKLYRETEQHEEKSRILRSLGGAKQQSQIDRVLKFGISDEVRSQDAISAIASCASSKTGREMAWSFLKDHQKLLVDRYSGSLLIARLVSLFVVLSFCYSNSLLSSSGQVCD